MRDTPSMAKNKIARSLRAILDPYPTKSEILKLWDYYESACAYCGTVLSRDSREGHLDHVISASSGGNNSIFNHVLACGRCNGDEKRERFWSEFLVEKVADSGARAARTTKIENWLRKNEEPPLSLDAREAGEEILKRAIEAFESAVHQMRKLRKRET